MILLCCYRNAAWVSRNDGMQDVYPAPSDGRHATQNHAIMLLYRIEDLPIQRPKLCAKMVHHRGDAGGGIARVQSEGKSSFGSWLELENDTTCGRGSDRSLSRLCRRRRRRRRRGRRIGRLARVNLQSQLQATTSYARTRRWRFRSGGRGSGLPLGHGFRPKFVRLGELEFALRRRG
jgi:hypothetical protein